MTDHSTARALELAANIMASMRRAKFPSEYAAEAHDEFEATVLVPMLIEALTPPEGDTVSEGTVEQLIVAVHALIAATDGMEALRPQRQAALDAMERAAIAAIQSRVSPQAGMREALERAQSQVGTLAREILREVGAGTCDNWVNALNGIAREINAALSTALIPSEDAK